MNSNQVIEIYELFKNNDIHVCIDGGWGVDALLQKITREHSDLDIVIESKFKDKAVQMLTENGYIKIINDDSQPWNFVLMCDSNIIDFHLIEFDQNGNGIYGPTGNGIFYPYYAFNFTGIIEKVEVNCISPKYQMESHTGYKLTSKDFHDVSLLSKKFGIPVPQEYSNFIKIK